MSGAGASVQDDPAWALRAPVPATVVVRPGSYVLASFVWGQARSSRSRRCGALGSSGSEATAPARASVSPAFPDAVVEELHVANFGAGIGVDDASHVIVRRNMLRANQSTGVQSTGVSYVQVSRQPSDRPWHEASDSGHRGLRGELLFLRPRLCERQLLLRAAQPGAVVQAPSPSRLGDREHFRRMSARRCAWNIGQNDDDSEGDMTSSRITVERNRFRRSSRVGSATSANADHRAERPVRVGQEQPLHLSCELGVYHTASPQHARPGRRAQHGPAQRGEAVATLMRSPDAERPLRRRCRASRARGGVSTPSSRTG